MRYAMAAHISRKYRKRLIKRPLHWTPPHKRTLPHQAQIRPQPPTNMRVVEEAPHPLSSPFPIHAINDVSSRVVDAQVDQDKHDLVNNIHSHNKGVH